MTNYEAVKADLLTYTASKAKIEKELLREGLTPSENFDLSNAQAVARVVVRILRGFIHLKEESEGGLKNSYDVDNLKSYLLEYASDNDIEELVYDLSPGDRISDKSDTW